MRRCCVTHHPLIRARVVALKKVFFGFGHKRRVVFEKRSFGCCCWNHRKKSSFRLERFHHNRDSNVFEMKKGTARFAKLSHGEREEEERGEEEEKARFSDETGEALNEAAFRLIREATKEDATTTTTTTTLEEDRLDDDEDESSSSLKWIETVKITPGRHKYVLIDVYNERNERKLIVRSYANCGYHADNYRVGMRELRDDSHFSASGGVRGRVIGGGRIEYDPESKSVNVYGYSMTFGRTPGCNKKTMEIIQREMGLVHAQWSDDGY